MSGDPVIDDMARAAGLDPASLTQWQREVLAFQFRDDLTASMERIGRSLRGMSPLFTGLTAALAQLAPLLDVLGARRPRLRRMRHLYRLRRGRKW